MKQDQAKLILARDGFPYLGGSSTLLYLLFESLQKKLPRAECWNIVTPRVWAMGRKHYGPYWTNPKGLKNVRTFFVNGSRGEASIRMALRKKSIVGVLSKNRKTTTLLKRLNSHVPVWHLTSTCSIIKNAVASDRLRTMESAIRKMRRGQFPKFRCPEELQAVRSADRILFHTKNMRFWYYTFYPQHREKMEEEIFWDYPLLKKQFHQVHGKNTWRKRSIDLLFVATDWRRGEKNFPLLKQLCRSFKGKKIMVVGFLPERLPDSVITFDTMSQDDVVQAMGQAKVLVCSSRYDEAPNVLFEAAIAGANIVCSKNCGNYKLTREEYVARLKPDDFVRKIKLALRRYRPANTEDFLKGDLSHWVFKQLSSKETR